MTLKKIQRTSYCSTCYDVIDPSTLGIRICYLILCWCNWLLMFCRNRPYGNPHPADRDGRDRRPPQQPIDDFPSTGYRIPARNPHRRYTLLTNHCPVQWACSWSYLKTKICLRILSPTLVSWSHPSFWCILKTVLKLRHPNSCLNVSWD